MNKKDAIRAIDKHGMLLAFPIDNRPEPRSLWSVFYPRSKMLWEWDEGGDNRVAELWHMREELSRSKKVVYVKWLKGRATFLSRDLFRALLAVYQRQHRFRALSREARELLSLLEENSPQSTKQLKRASGLVGRDLEGTYTRAMQELWNRLLIVAFGEVDEGAFPSLAIGASKWIFEDLYREAREMKVAEAEALIDAHASSSPSLLKQHLRVLAQLGMHGDTPHPRTRHRPQHGSRNTQT